MLRTQVRPAEPTDASALHDLVAGLSPRSGRRRFLVGVGVPSSRMVAAMLRQDATHGAWVCVHGDRLVGHVMWGVDEGAAELGVVVADAWQRRGIGRSLTAAAAAEARSHGLADVRLHVSAENSELARRLSAGATASVLADGMVTVTRPLTDLLTDRERSSAPAAARADLARAGGRVSPAWQPSWARVLQVLTPSWASSRPWATSASAASATRPT